MTKEEITIAAQKEFAHQIEIRLLPNSSRRVRTVQSVT